MKVALVYDRVNKIGGAEKVLLALHEIWPQAPLFTAVYEPKKTPWAASFKVVPSFLQNLPFAKERHEFFPWLTPAAFESFNFREFDVVISVTSAEAKYLITQPQTLHVCYCLTPTRYLWSGFKTYLENPGFGVLAIPARFLFRFVAPELRMVDQVAAARPDCYVAISREVQGRIKKYYRKESQVIYPPVEVERFGIAKFISRSHHRLKSANPSGAEYFLVVSRLVPYKKVDLVVKTFNDLGWSLKIVGTGNQMKYLKKIANHNIKFLGELTERELVYYYQHCRALILAAEEDFGIVSVEAQAAGKPVIALAKGGALETVSQYKTGLFFRKQTAEDLKLALIQFDKLKFNPSICKKNTEKFSKKIFINKFKKFIKQKWQQYQKQKRKPRLAGRKQ